MLKDAIFLAFLTQKLVPSRVLNDIIFCIDEQCGFRFETTLFTNGKIYIIFLFNWGPLSPSLSAVFLIPCFFPLTISLLSLSLCSTPPSPMKPRSKYQAKPIFFYSLNALSVLYLSLSSLTSFFSLLSLCFTNVVRQ